MRSNVTPEELENAFAAVASKKAGKVTGHALWIALGQRCSKTTTENYVKERKSMETPATPVTFSKIVDDLNKHLAGLVAIAVDQERDRNQTVIDQKDQVIKRLQESVENLTQLLSDSQTNLNFVRDTVEKLKDFQAGLEERMIKAEGVSEHWRSMYDDLKGKQIDANHLNRF